MDDEYKSLTTPNIASAVGLAAPSGASSPQPGTALCLSGGGYRAMLFHAGAGMWLSEVGLLGQLDQILSVSGGSITASVLGLGWSKLKFDGSGRASNLSEVVIAPIRTLAARTIDVGSVLSGVFGMGTVAGKIADRYRKYLFGVATLQDLPDHPRFVINATNVQSNRSGGFRNRTCGIGEWARPETQRLNSLLPSAVHLPFRQFSPRWSWI